MDTAQYKITNYDPSAKYFSMSVTYSMGAGGRQSVVSFVYNQSAQTPDFVWDSEKPLNHYVSYWLIFSEKKFIFERFILVFCVGLH